MWEKLSRKRTRTNVIRIWNYVKKEKVFYPVQKKKPSGDSSVGIFIKP
jgi:hypothetical protein